MKADQDKFVDELVPLMDRYIPAMTPAEFMQVFAFQIVNVMLSSGANLSREKIIADVTTIAGATFDEYMTMLTEIEGEPNAKNVH